MQEARQSWKAAIDGFSPGDDLQMIGDAIAFCRHPDLSRETLSTMQQAQAPARQSSSSGRNISPQSTQVQRLPTWPRVAQRFL